jgi:hypothetical protein
MDKSKVMKVESNFLPDHLVEKILQYSVLYPTINKGRYVPVESVLDDHYWDSRFLLPVSDCDGVNNRQLFRFNEMHFFCLKAMEYLPCKRAVQEFVTNSYFALRAAMSSSDEDHEEEFQVSKKQTVTNCQQIISVYDRHDFPKFRDNYYIEKLRGLVESALEESD